MADVRAAVDAYVRRRTRSGTPWWVFAVALFVVNTVRQENQIVTLNGVAQSNERVSELLRNLSNNSPWLKRPELVEIVAGNVALTARDQRRVANFTVKVRVLRASEVKPAAPAERLRDGPDIGCRDRR